MTTKTQRLIKRIQEKESFYDIAYICEDFETFISEVSEWGVDHIGGVDFQQGLRGNINQRVMEFHQRVEAIWGPVPQWGETLEFHAAAGLSPGAVGITSDVLSVGQSPVRPGHQGTTLELSAGGNVLVEGDTFTARSTRLSWSEEKDLLVF